MKAAHEIILKESTILLAEDDDGLRNIFKKILLLYVKEVYEASDGEEAYKLYLQRRPDIVITDIKMPKINGLEFIKKIREKERNTPIIVTSAYADQELLLESIKLYLVEYLIKPIKDEDLTRVLTRCADTISENRKDAIIDLPEGYRYDIRNKTIFSPDGKSVSLTTKEIELIELLLEHRGTLVTKQTIEEKLYRYEEAPPSALKNLVFKVRKKVPGTILKTVGKLGYTID
jgi:DNA-binding response OmpR family regulator